MNFTKGISKRSLEIGLGSEMLNKMAAMDKKPKGIEDSMAWAIKHNEKKIFIFLLDSRNGIDRCLNSSETSKQLVRKGAIWTAQEIIDRKPNKPCIKILIKSLINGVNNAQFLHYIIVRWGDEYKNIPNLDYKIKMALLNTYRINLFATNIVKELKMLGFDQSYIDEIIKERKIKKCLNKKP